MLRIVLEVLQVERSWRQVPDQAASGVSGRGQWMDCPRGSGHLT
jgi:hypothetical protein